jgi:hypothetical protein
MRAYVAHAMSATAAATGIAATSRIDVSPSPFRMVGRATSAMIKANAAAKVAIAARLASRALSGVSPGPPVSLPSYRMSLPVVMAVDER